MGRECSWSTRSALGVGCRTKVGTEEEEEKRGRGRRERSGKERAIKAVILWAIAYAVVQSRVVRQGEDKHHCTGEGERLRERGGGGNQLSTSPPPGREAQWDRSRRRHSLTHSFTHTHTHTVKKTHWRAVGSTCRGQKGVLGVPLLASRSTKTQAGPAKKKKKFDGERGVGSPSPVSSPSSATFSSPWENGLSWRGCWRQLSSSTLPWLGGKTLIDFVCGFYFSNLHLLFDELGFYIWKMLFCMFQLMVSLQKPPLSQACPSTFLWSTVPHNHPCLPCPFLHPALLTFKLHIIS